MAHEDEIARIDNAYTYKSLCREYLKNPEHYFSVIRDMNYIRPKELHLYKDDFSAAKLATRVSENPLRILDAYLDAHYTGAVTALLEPDNGVSLQPVLVDNSRFPKGFAEHVGNCDKNCENCNYCRSVYEKTKIELPEANFTFI